MSEKAKALLGQVLFLAIGVGMYAYTVASDFQIRSKNDIGSGGVPKIICGLIIVLSVIKIIMILRDKNISSEPVVNGNLNVRKGMLVIGILAVYCFAMKSIGFFILNPLMLFFEMVLMAPKEKRRYVLFAVISIVATVVIFCVFFYGLDLMLPAGLLKEFL